VRKIRIRSVSQAFASFPVRSIRPGPAVPDEYRFHLLVRDRLFFTVPRDLVDAVVRAVGPRSFDPDMLRLERALAEESGDHSQHVGFWGNRPIGCSFFRTRPIQYRKPLIALAGYTNDEKLTRIVEEAQRDLERHHKETRAFAGWLLSNPTFLREHNDLCAAHKAEIASYGFPQGHLFASAAPSRLPPGLKPANARVTAYGQELQAFFERWRLKTLLAPFLPSPQHVQLPVPHRSVLAGQADSSGSLYLFPDIASVPSRDELRRALEQSECRSNPPEHLADWIAIVRGSNPSKIKLSRYARIFLLQHYWRALHSRHADALKGQTGKLEEEFAAHLRASASAIHKDLLFLRRRLGPDWVQYAME
jgi:hypothetical protein